MNSVYTSITKLRRQVFAEIARLAYEGGDRNKFEELPYRIIPGEVPTYRNDVFMERAIVGERLRLACGLPLRNADEYGLVSSGVKESAVPERFYQPPLVNVIPFACNACAETSYLVTEHCQKCLAHPCVNVCPVQAVSKQEGHKSHIDPDKCIRCGRCLEACPYSAIIQTKRPCAEACGVDAIESDYLGRAKINYDKCVSCGQCMVHCPFGAIADKSQILQLILAIRSGAEVIAEIAPSFVGQFGPLATPEKVKEALKILGFSKVYEVAMGADLGSISEAHHYVNKVASGVEPVMATSCCPAWSVLAKRDFPDIAPYVSYELTPMVATARVIKQEHPDAKVVFIGPCAAKKLEASRRSVESQVDFVITFEELMGMFVAKDIDFGAIEVEEPLQDASSAGRGYAVAGGVASAITECVGELYPGVEVKVDHAEGLRSCRKMLLLAKSGKRDGYLLEGMACPGGCIGGAGTLTPLNKAAAEVHKFQDKADMKKAVENPHKLEEKA